MKFSDALKEETNWTKTENGMDAVSSTGSFILDFFGNILDYRYQPKNVTCQAFNRAYNEDKLLAMKLLFYIRNIRGLGQGERQTFRTIIHYLANEHSEVMRLNLDNIWVFGRFDDYYALVGTKLEAEAFDILKSAVKHDLEEPNDNKLTLVGKWLKSVNTSSKNSVYLGKLTAQKFGLTEADYRKLLSSLRKRIDVVERKMSGKQYDLIDYAKVPSKAMMIYRNAFSNNDETRFNEYLEKVKSGEKKINSSAVYPYEILRAMNLNFVYNYHDYTSSISLDNDETLQLQWEALPDYIGKESDTVAVVDTSGSMEGLPLTIALSIGVYLAERNQGPWHNKMITFSEKPKYIELVGDTIYQKLNGIECIVENTDIIKVFDLLLKTAVIHNLKPEEMIKRIVIVSDMQFDEGTEEPERELFTDSMKKKFAKYGYALPEIVYWNASPYYKNTFHSVKNSQGVMLVSGASPSIYMSVLKNEFKSPYEEMLEILNDKIFDIVKV